MMRGPGWREITAAVGAALVMSVSLVAYAYEHFASKADVESRLERIEAKVDCLLDRKLCSR